MLAVNDLWREEKEGGDNLHDPVFFPVHFFLPITKDFSSLFFNKVEKGDDYPEHKDLQTFTLLHDTRRQEFVKYGGQRLLKKSQQNTPKKKLILCYTRISCIYQWRYLYGTVSSVCFHPCYFSCCVWVSAGPERVAGQGRLSGLQDPGSFANPLLLPNICTGTVTPWPGRDWPPGPGGTPTSRLYPACCAERSETQYSSQEIICY